MGSQRSFTWYGPDMDMVIEEAGTEIFSLQVDGGFVRRGDYVVFILGNGDGFYEAV